MGTQALWSDHIWQPWRGCVRVSAGCQNCYMFRTLQQLKRDPTIVLRSNYDDWTLPYRLKGGMVQVCSQSDFFIDQADEWRAAAWDVMRDNPQLVYQILTKRPGRIEKHLPRDWGEGWVNVVLGVSAEDQTTADVRIPQLLRVPAAHYFVSAQPLLGPMHVASHLSPRRVSLVLTGCESGPDSRPHGHRLVALTGAAVQESKGSLLPCATGGPYLGATRARFVPQRTEVPLVKLLAISRTCTACGLRR